MVIVPRGRRPMALLVLLLRTCTRRGGGARSGFGSLGGTLGSGTGGIVAPVGQSVPALEPVEGRRDAQSGRRGNHDPTDGPRNRSRHRTSREDAQAPRNRRRVSPP